MSDGTIQELSGLPMDTLNGKFRECCGSEWWAKRMAEQGPYEGVAQLHAIADETFDRMPRDEWLEAFASHPRIGDLKSLKMRFAGNNKWSSAEQSGAGDADEAVLRDLQLKNQVYHTRFGHVFIVCATGKSAIEMLAILNQRLNNSAEDEFRLASSEQRKIAHLRIDKLLSQ